MLSYLVYMNIPQVKTATILDCVKVETCTAYNTNRTQALVHLS